MECSKKRYRIMWIFINFQVIKIHKFYCTRIWCLCYKIYLHLSINKLVCWSMTILPPALSTNIRLGCWFSWLFTPLKRLVICLPKWSTLPGHTTRVGSLPCPQILDKVDVSYLKRKKSFITWITYLAFKCKITIAEGFIAQVPVFNWTEKLRML